jgi:hypothetical protein
MPLYLTTSRIPELAEFALTQRRQLLSAALRDMKTKRRLVASLPTLLALSGAAVGLNGSMEWLRHFLGSHAASTIDQLPFEWMVLLPSANLGFLIGWFVGQSVTFAAVRPYLREVIDRAIARMSSSS